MMMMALSVCVRRHKAEVQYVSLPLAVMETKSIFSVIFDPIMGIMTHTLLSTSLRWCEPKSEEINRQNVIFREIYIIVFSLLSPSEWHAAHLSMEKRRKLNLLSSASKRRTKDPLDE